MRFSYTRYSATVMRPVIPVTLKYERRAIDCDLMIDSGADINVLDTELAEALGIDLTRAVQGEIVAATGDIKRVFVHPVTVVVGGATLKTRAAFMADAAADYGLAGQQGFFDHFAISFMRKDEELELLLNG